MKELFYYTDYILFILLSISVGYLTIFSFFSMVKKGRRYPKAIKKFKFLVLIPAYKEDNVIFDSVKSVLEQEYPSDKFDLVVISDRMTDHTNSLLSQERLTLHKISPENSSKAYALNFAITNLKHFNYDVVVILDADNVVPKNYLDDINDIFYSGSKALQTHRIAKNLNTDMAILDAISEEINNSIFRRGHVNIGLSSALIGSGMAFDFKWFSSKVKYLKTSGEDKELEIMLLKDCVYIDFADYIYVYDEKIQKEDAFYNQRRRWLAAQFYSLVQGIKDLPQTIMNNNIDYIDKVIQWALLPRIIVMGLIGILTLLNTFFDFYGSIKWWILLMILFFAFAMAIPDYLVNKRSIRTFLKIPLLFMLMVLNLFRLRGVTKKFIHTEKGI